MSEVNKHQLEWLFAVLLIILGLTIFTLGGCSEETRYVPAPSCTVTQGTSSSTVQCPDGTTATINNGQIGEIGPQGNPGQNGTPGTQITAVQLCSSCVGAYPSEFPEIALCSDNVLWAVYSLNGGFLVQLSNGTYSSNGINCSCNFTVNGCVVTQL